MQYTATYDSPLGKITMAGSERGLAGLWFEGQKYFADTLSGETAEKEDFPLLFRSGMAGRLLQRKGSRLYAAVGFAGQRRFD